MTERVSIPTEPTWETLLFLAGNPVLLAASDEERIRAWYAEFVAIAAKESEK